MDNPAAQFIEIAPDSTLKAAVVPQERNGKPTITTIEYELLTKRPYRYTLSELKFATWTIHKPIGAEELKANRQKLRDAFFAKSYACMRASPLTRKYGWGAHYDEQGHIAIYAVESREYKNFVQDKNMKKYSAMHSKRA